MINDFTFDETGFIRDHTSAGGASADPPYALDPQGKTADVINGTTGTALPPLNCSPFGTMLGDGVGICTCQQPAYIGEPVIAAASHKVEPLNDRLPAAS